MPAKIWEKPYFKVCNKIHLRDFGGQGNSPQNENELFNLRHASLKNVIEWVFDIFKSRFTIFKTAPPFFI